MSAVAVRVSTDERLQLHAHAVALAESRLGRPLTLGERNLDLVGLDRDLERAKKRLASLIDLEKRRALRSHFNREAPVNIRLTPAMAATMRALYLTGRRHAREEIQRMTGIKLAEHEFASDLGPGYTRALQKFGGHLGQFQTRVANGAAQVDIGGEAGRAVIAKALRVPGALNVASQVVATGLLAGIGDVYSTEAGLFTSFVYSAVMDSGTCAVCAPLDGTVYDSWDAIQEVLPDGGPNPDCEGGDRCRCRAVPGDVAGVEEPTPPVEPPVELPPAVAEDLRRARLEPGVVDEATAREIAGLGPRVESGEMLKSTQKTVAALDSVFAPAKYGDPEKEIYAWYRSPEDFTQFEGQLRQGKMTGDVWHGLDNLRPSGRPGGQVAEGFAPAADLKKWDIPFTRVAQAITPDPYTPGLTTSGPALKIPLKPLIDKFDAMFAESPALPNDVTFYRGTQTVNRIFGPGGPKAGESYIERGYMSMSADPTVAEMFAQGMSGAIPGEGGSAFIEVTVPKGAKGIWARSTGPDQIDEFTLPRHSKLVVDRVETINIPSSEYVTGGPQRRIFAHIELPKADPADIGITPFRAGIDNPVDFYNSDRFKRFEDDVQQSADYYGVTVDEQTKATGIWEGTTEPSVSLHVHDSVEGVRAYSANLAKAYEQDGVLVFNDQSFDSALLTFDHGPSHDEIVAAMKEVGISGGRFTADGRLQIIGAGPDFVAQASKLADRLGVKYHAETGHFALIEKDGYDTALRNFDGKGATPRPELPGGPTDPGISGMATADGEGATRLAVTNAVRAQADRLSRDPLPELLSRAGAPGATAADKAAGEVQLRRIADELRLAREHPDIVDEATPEQVQGYLTRPDAPPLTGAETRDTLVRHAAQVFHRRSNDLRDVEDLGIYQDPQGLGVRWATAEFRRLTGKSLSQQIQEASRRLNDAKDKLDKARLVHGLVTTSGMTPAQAAAAAASVPLNPVPTSFLPGVRLVPGTQTPTDIVSQTPGLQAQISERSDVIEISHFQVGSYSDNVRQLGSGYSPKDILLGALSQIIVYADRVGKAIAITPVATAGMTALELQDWLRAEGFVPNPGLIPGVNESLLRDPVAPTR